MGRKLSQAGPKTRGGWRLRSARYCIKHLVSLYYFWLRVAIPNAALTMVAGKA
jgi:hypothetical protein